LTAAVFLAKIAPTLVSVAGGVMAIAGAVVLTFLLAYLIGGVPFGYLVARGRGVDILHQGSGNIGATNVGRVLGRRFGVLVFALDFAKGALPVVAAQAAARTLPLDLPTARAVQLLGVVAGLAAFLGHLFPVYLRFRGGKGVATGAGVVAMLLPGPTVGALLTWVAVLCATQYVSVASLAAAAALCALRLLLTPAPWAEQNVIVTVFCFVAAALVFVRHRANIARLLHGNENRLNDSLAMQLLAKTIHVLALGLWFGSAMFFSFVVALTLFHTLEAEASLPQQERPLWFPLPAPFDQDAQTRKEQGTRAAGVAISPMFDWYFLLQGVCGFLAVATALSWPRVEPRARVHRVRVVLLLLAVVSVVAGWPLERKVSELRAARNEASDAWLTQSASLALNLPAALEKELERTRTVAQEARAEFGRWHFYSLMLNFGTLLLVTVAMALAARLPPAPPRPAEKLLPPVPS
jgi:acyl-phosphate glycerol 3-phosphate acyltransferase